MKKMKKFIVLFTVSLAVFACSDSDDDTTDQSSDGFDRGAMLINFADNIILPSYQSYISTTQDLVSQTDSFVVTPSIEELTNLRSAFRTAYLSFQNVSIFEIGLAEELRFRDRTNTYPTNIQEVTSFIVDGNFNFELPSTNDAQGLPAIDYLLYGLGTDEETVAFFTTDANAEGYRNYLFALVNSINILAQNVLNDWTSGFRNTFVANDGSSASASVDNLTNDFILYYEKSLRAGKIGIPAGVFSNDPLPGNVEALYAQDFSKELAIEALNASIRFFNGRSFVNSQSGPSYATYLDFLNTIKNEEDLSTLINNQFATSIAALNTLDSDFTNQIATNNNAMLETYDELQRNVILLKVDLLQAINVNIDFVDADGD